MRKFTKLFTLWLFVGLLALNGMTQTTITIGTGTSTDRYPLGDYYVYQRSQMLFLSSEIGIPGNITHLRWYRDDVGASTGGDVEIWLKETTATSITGATWEDPGTLVFSQTSLDLGEGDAWLEIDISDFAFSGSNSLLVSTYVQNAPYVSPHTYWRYTSTSTTMMRRGQSDYSNPPSLSTSTYRPNIQMDITPITTPVLSVNPGSVDYGNVETGTCSDWQSFTLSNIGAGTLNISSIYVTGTDFDQFEIQNNPAPCSLPPDATVDVRFCPSSDGAKTAYLTIVDDLADQTTNIQLDGTGYTPLPGDNCSNAIDLNVETSPYNGSTSSMYNDFSFCSMGSSNDFICYYDVEDGGTIEIWQSYNDFDSRHTMRFGGVCPGDNEIDCIDDGDYDPITWTNTTGNTERIWFIVGGYSSNSGNFTLEWTYTAPGGPPATPTNPNPSDLATNVAIDGDLTWDWGLLSETYDLWFGEAGNMAQVVTGGSVTGPSGSYTFSSLSYTTSYEWKLIVYNSNKSQTTGPVWSFTTVDAPTPGDNCSDPIVVSLPASLPYSDMNQYTCGRGDDYSATCLGNYDGGEDIIYEITVTTDVTVDITLDPKGITYTGILIDNVCPGASTCIDYSTNSGSSPHGLAGVSLAAGTYYIMVDTWPSPDCIPDFDLTITQAAGPPANDDCSGAIGLAVDYSCNYTTATNAGATDSGLTPGCANYSGGDVWFSADVPDNGYMVIEGAANGGFTDGGMAVWTGTCGSLSLYECNDDGGPSVMPLIEINDLTLAGQTVYISFWEYGNDSFGPFDICAHTSPSTATWTGAISNDWHDTGNWDTGVPGSITDVTIPAGLSNYPTISASALCNNISLGSDASGTATLLDNGYLIIYGTASVERYFSGNDPDWHLVSVPVYDAYASVFTGMYLQSFDPTTYNYTEITDENTGLNPMTGYGLYSTMGATNTVTFTGHLNTGIQSKSIVTGPDSYNWNLLGNPFPSSIDWETVTIPTNMTNEVHYIEAATGNDLAYVQGTGGTGSQYIAPMQGFFVSATGTDALQIGNTERTHAGAGTFYKSDNPNLLILEAAGENYTDDTWINFNEEAGVEHDGRFDAYKRISLSNPELPQIFSYTASGEKLAINGLPQTEMVPVGFTAVESGQFTMSAKETGEFNDIVLEDLLLNTLTDLTTDSYTFDYEAGSMENRFIVHFAPVGISDNPANNVNIYSYNKDVYVTVPAYTTGTIKIYNMMGQEVVSQSINDVVNRITLSQSANYVVVVIGDAFTMTEKVFVK